MLKISDRSLLGCIHGLLLPVHCIACLRPYITAKKIGDNKDLLLHFRNFQIFKSNWFYISRAFKLPIFSLLYSRWNMVSFFLFQSGAVVGLLSMRWQFCCWDLGSGVFAWGQLCSKWHRASRRWWVLPDRYRTKHGRKELLYSPSCTNYHDGPGKFYHIL